MALKDNIDAAKAIAGNEVSAGLQNRNSMLATAVQLTAGANSENAIVAQAKTTEEENKILAFSAASAIEMQKVSTQMYGDFKLTFDAMNNDVKLHQTVLDKNNARLTELESDPTRNNVLLHPIKTIGAMIEKANIKDINNAHTVELNSVIDKQQMASATFLQDRKQVQDTIAANASAVLARDYQTRLNSAQQMEQAALQRQKDKLNVAQATQGSAASMSYQEDGNSSAALAKQGIDINTLLTYKAAKLGTPLDVAFADEADKIQTINAFNRETEEVKKSMTDLNLQYRGDTNLMKKLPRDYLYNTMLNTNDNIQSSAINSVLDNPNQQLAAIGTSEAMKQVQEAGMVVDKDGNLTASTGGESSVDKLKNDAASRAAIAGRSPTQHIVAGARYVMSDIGGLFKSQPLNLHTATTNIELLTRDPHIAQIAAQDPSLVQELNVAAQDVSMAYGDVMDTKLFRLNEALLSRGLSKDQAALALTGWMQLSMLDGYQNFGGKYSAQTKQAVAVMGETRTSINIPVYRAPLDAPGLFTGNLKGNVKGDGFDISNPEALKLYLQGVKLSKTSLLSPEFGKTRQEYNAATEVKDPGFLTKF